ncbi:nucleolar protein 6 [Diplogelasinospora grovesii]|uniref:U3 small nucleolar RNA-associated protein 22 n=1 Tax=Diplogelasinospora grovesii TaxID=303347 RepID=A0AAN6NA55_9PEZI|nr:nucleolar protein 6 [Diplogelasinospora grovesii]
MDSNPAKRRKLENAEEEVEKALALASSSGLSMREDSSGLFMTKNAAGVFVPPRVSKSKIFVLETYELAVEVKLNKTALPGADDLLHRAKECIEKIESHDSLPIAEAASKLEEKHGIRVPFPEPRPPENSNYKVSFAKPAQFNVVGSYVSKTMVESQKDYGVDMVVVMPEEILQEKDYLDLRYFYKRAYYLAVLAVSLQEELGSSAKLSYEHLNGNHLCPVLALQPYRSKTPKTTRQFKADSSKKDYRIRIIPCAPEGFFPKSKLHLGASLNRKGQDEGSKTATQPTPFYNSTLVAEGCFLSYLKLFRQIERKCQGFKDACRLGRVWLQQRGFEGHGSDGGFGHFEWALILALLIQGGGSRGTAALSPQLNSTQLFRAMIQFLSVTDLSEKACVLGAGERPDLQEAVKSGPIIYDSARQLNVAFKMSPSSAAFLHQHAKWTRSLLNEDDVDKLDATFILKADVPFQSFDLVARLKYDGALDESVTADCRGRVWEFRDKVYRILKRALADKELGARARLIHICSKERSSWPLTADSSSPPEDPIIEIRILFDPLNMARTVDRGPTAGASAEEKEECEKFRRFWGEKSELRRFERDSIREALIWTSTTPFELCEEIMRYILNLHIKIGYVYGDLTFYGNEFSALLPLKHTDTATFNAARKAFSDFEKEVRELEGLPLHVRQIAPICPELRHASVKPPSFGPSKSGPRPMECVISFEASGKWPESLAAIQRTKIAFLQMIGKLLEQDESREVKTYVGLDNAKSDEENLAFLDVVYESGASFRLRIHSDLEETLLDRQVKDKTVEQHVRTKATTLLANFRRLHTYLPLHTQSINTYVTRFPALSGTIRLLKHWFSAHKLTSHFTEEFIELVALHVFLVPYPWDAPSSAHTGFLRALLFLSRWDWRLEQLVLDTGDDVTAVDREAIDTRFHTWRTIDPRLNHCVLFVATAYDPSGTGFTRLAGQPKPSNVVATRMTALAKSACRVVKDEGLDLVVKKLFVHSNKDYDVQICLNSKALKSAQRTYATDDPEGRGGDGGGSGSGGDGGRASKFKNLDERTGQDMLPIVQHPSDVLLEQLNTTYADGGPLVFFRGEPDEDNVIAAIWNPHMCERRRTFKVNLPTSYKPVGGVMEVEVEGGVALVEGVAEVRRVVEEEEEQVDVNKEAIVSEIARIGGDLIEEILLPKGGVM